MKKLSLNQLGRLSVGEFKTSEKLPVSIVLDNIRSLHNVGSVFRTADAFRVAKIYLTGITGTPPHREIHKTALGATDSIDWEYEEDPARLVHRLKTAGHRIVVVEQTTESKALHQFDSKERVPVCLVFGNEIHGVSESVIEQADAALEIPQHGTKHSLNI